MKTIHKYLFLQKNSNISIYLNTIEELKEYYYKTCNKKYLEIFKEEADNTFYSNMKNDGYLIIKNIENIFYFIEINKIHNIFKDVNDQEVINTLNQKLLKLKHTD